MTCAAPATSVSRVQQSLAAQFCQFIQIALSDRVESPPASKFGSLLPPCGHDYYCRPSGSLLTQVQRGNSKHSTNSAVEITPLKQSNY